MEKSARFLNGTSAASFGGYMFSANGAHSRQPGASPQGACGVTTSAEGAIHFFSRFVIAELNRTFSAYASGITSRPGAMPQASQVTTAPLALSTYSHGAVRRHRVRATRAWLQVLRSTKGL